MSGSYGVRALTSPAGGAQATFPALPYASAASYLDAYTEESARAAKSVDTAALGQAASILLEAYQSGATVFSCGNGGSAAISNHLQCDHVKSVRAGTSLSPRVVSLSANLELLTAIANDMAYEDIFVYQLESLAQPGDVLVVISSSGRSPNIVKALRWARGHGVRTVALVGFGGGDAKAVAEVVIHVDNANYGIVEDLHQAIMHCLAQYIRQSQMTAGAISSGVF